LKNTQEVEKIRILKTERIQDGVNRIVFAAGKMADAHLEDQQEFYEKILKHMEPLYTIKETKDVSTQLEESARIFSVTVHQLDKTIQRFMKETEKKQRKKIEVSDLTEAAHHLFTTWKETQKMRKKVPLEELSRMKNNAESIQGTDFKVVGIVSIYDAITIAGQLIADKNYIVHVHDGKKLVSAASENVPIDLREIAPEIGKILGGSGGGKTKLTQCGGPKTENIEKALEKAKELTKKKLVKK
jgi:alanyl-tRNA synthetase